MKNLALPAAVAGAFLLLWNTSLVYPLKIFVVFLHEISHGLAAVATGGAIERIELTFDQGGVCFTRGGSPFLVASAGYLGSLLWGVVLLALASRSRWDRGLLALIGLFTLAVTVVYVRSSFGFAYGLAAGTALLLVAWKLPAAASDFVLKTIGVVSALYAVWDIASDVLLRDIPGSDANALAEITGIPALAWGIGWVIASALAIALALRLSVSPSGGPHRAARPPR